MICAILDKRRVLREDRKHALVCLKHILPR